MAWKTAQTVDKEGKLCRSLFGVTHQGIDLFLRNDALDNLTVFFHSTEMVMGLIAHVAWLQSVEKEPPEIGSSHSESEKTQMLAHLAWLVSIFGFHDWCPSVLLSAILPPKQWFIE
jgi:hypothetical protein